MKSFFICLLFPVFIYAQQSALSIGDHIPSSVLDIIKSKTGTADKNKIILLDFFATYCTACIRSLPKLDSLQQQFNGQLQIIIVANESSEKLETLRKKNLLFANCQLPVVSGDTIFKKLFPHQYLPHNVWLDRHGKLLAVTDQYAVSKENILSFLNNKNPNLPFKADAFDFDRSKPLLLADNGGTNANLLFQSKFTGFLPGIATSDGTVKEKNSTRFYFINHPVLSLYKKALGFEYNRIILETPDSDNYSLPGEITGEWREKNLFSYELVLPAEFGKETLSHFMTEDLNRYLRLFGRIEKRKMNCWAIVQSNPGDTSLKSKSGKQRIIYNETTGKQLYQNQPFAKLVARLNILKYPAPGNPIFLDETGIIFNIDMDLPKPPYNNIPELRKELLCYGLDITPVQREIDMFILSETKNPTARK